MRGQKKKSGSKEHAEHVEEAHAVWEGRLLWSQRQVTGWSDNQTTADKTEAGLAEQDAANWAHGEKHERLPGRLERGKSVRSNVQGTQICHLPFGTE